nr:MAG TPA: hypothetical protein [Caudoviricetes sp.]DAQ34702.1 MAG TPA: hypothetical protein [Caudoviricetes sp.]
MKRLRAWLLHHALFDDLFLLLISAHWISLLL